MHSLAIWVGRRKGEIAFRLLLLTSTVMEMSEFSAAALAEVRVSSHRFHRYQGHKASILSYRLRQLGSTARCSDNLLMNMAAC